jgi:hypothetical protein
MRRARERRASAWSSRAPRPGEGTTHDARGRTRSSAPCKKLPVTAHVRSYIHNACTVYQSIWDGLSPRCDALLDAVRLFVHEIKDVGPRGRGRACRARRAAGRRRAAPPHSHAAFARRSAPSIFNHVSIDTITSPRSAHSRPDPLGGKPSRTRHARHSRSRSSTHDTAQHTDRWIESTRLLSRQSNSGGASSSPSPKRTRSGCTARGTWAACRTERRARPRSRAAACTCESSGGVERGVGAALARARARCWRGATSPP